MTNVALFDTSASGPSGSFARFAIGGSRTLVYLAVQLYRTAAQTAAQSGDSKNAVLWGSGGEEEAFLVETDGQVFGWTDYATASGVFTSDAWHLLEMVWDMSLSTVSMSVDGVAGVDNFGTFLGETIVNADIGAASATASPGSGFYVGRVWIGTEAGAHDILLEDWSSGDFSQWTSTSGSPTIVTAPEAPPTLIPTLGTPSPAGRILIAPDDGPLEPLPTWVRIDDTNNLVAGYDIRRGKQTLISQTETGTMTVYLNDTTGRFDPNNTLSDLFGKLDGKQIMAQIWNPVTAEWVPQFRGTIDEIGYDINPATDQDGNLLVANLQIDCVDMFDFLAGYGLTPGLDGDLPTPADSEGAVYYAATAGTVDDRIIQILTDVGIDSTMWVVFTGNVSVQATLYDADESALTALRDAADAELPFIANIYIDKQGRFVFHGRYSRFAPDDVAADATPGAWDFTRWKLGDGQAIVADSDRGQMRVLRYVRGRQAVVNAALSYPKGILEADIPGQVYADATSITDYGKHALPPMSDLIVEEGKTAGSYPPSPSVSTGNAQCLLYATFLVKNQKDPRVAIETLTVKAMRPEDSRATATWAVLTGADISDIVNLKVGYPGGVGIGDPDGEDYYVEGVTQRVRPLNPTHDYVELDLDVSPAVWSQDTNGVFA